MAERVKRRLSAILSADVAGYSRLMEDDEERTVQTIESYRKTVTSLIEQHDGTVIDSPGDNIMSEFASVVDAVQCAVEIQHVIKAKNAVVPKTRRMQFRIGISLEDVIEEGDRIYGDGVNIASRIEGLADPGGICISAAAYVQIRRKLALGYEDLGEHSVKNISWPVQVYRIPLEAQEATDSSKDDTASSIDRPSIIVMPFANISPHPEQEYFSDGLTQEIITDLHQVHDRLLVISIGTAMAFKGTRKTIPEIARSVNVRYVLEGSVRKAANSLRISAQLVDAASDTQIWAERFDGTLDDVFDLQEKVSRLIVAALKLEIMSDEEARIGKRPSGNPQAYEYYLMAVGELQRGNPDSIPRILRDLKAGLDRIGDDIYLLAAMGQAYCDLREYGHDIREATLRNAEECATRMLALEPDSALGHSLMGRIERFHGSTIAAMGHFKRALDVDPNERQTLQMLGLINAWHLGRPNAAEPIIKELVKRDPLTPFNHLISGIYHWLVGESANALESFAYMLELEPANFLGDFWSTFVYLWDNQYDKAFAIIDRMANIESPAPNQMLFTAWLVFLRHALLGEKSRALGALSEDAREYFWTDPELPWIGADGFAILDEHDEAIRWLERAVDRGLINYPVLSESDPFLENIRGDKRFRELMERVKHEWENFEI